MMTGHEIADDDEAFDAAAADQINWTFGQMNALIIR
jgi:hypothetical protein